MENLEAKAYNWINADTEQKHRNKLKATIGEAEYKANRRNKWKHKEENRQNKKRIREEKNIKYIIRCY